MSVIDLLEDIKLNPEQVELLKGMIQEAVNSRYREQSEKDLRKEIATRAKEELEISTKLFNSLVTRAYKSDAEKVNAETTAVLDILEQLGYYQHEEN